MERSPQLAVLMLAVLKAGAAYMWIDGEDGGRWPDGVSISRRPLGEDEALIVVDRAALLDVTGRPAPNLPIVTRPDDLACVLPQRNGLPGVLRAARDDYRAAVTSAPDRAVWSGDVAALDLWLPLMAGGTVIVGRVIASDRSGLTRPRAHAFTVLRGNRARLRSSWALGWDRGHPA